MTDDTKTTFEFDPLPGDAKPAAVETAPTKPERKRRTKPAKPERKKRGPRRVQPAEPLAQLAAIVTNTPRAGESAEQTKARTRRRTVAEQPVEYAFIRQLLDMTEPTRKRVLAALKGVFG